jgi:hypothetical protein
MLTALTKHVTGLALLLGFAFASQAASPSATVRQVIGQASVPANTALPKGSSFSTRSKSRAELGLDKAFVRTASDTSIQVIDTNEIALGKGILLAGSDPARGRRRAVEVTTPDGYKMAGKGTALIASYPGEYITITVLEGNITVSLQSLTGEWIALQAGQRLIVKPSDKRLPDPVEVDIGELASTSQLLGGAFAELSTKELIEAFIATQGRAVRMGEIVLTPLRILGAAPAVQLALPHRTLPVEKSSAPAPAEAPLESPTLFQLVNDLEDPNVIIQSRALPVTDHYSGPIKFQYTGGARTQVLEIELATPATDDLGNPIAYVTPYITGAIKFDPMLFGGQNKAAEFLTPAGLGLSVHDATITTPLGVDLKFNGYDGLTVLDSTLMAKPDADLQLMARTGEVSITGSTLKGADVSIKGSTTDDSNAPGPAPDQPISIANTSITAGRDINIGSSDTPTTVVLNNSSELNALLGAITIQSKGKPITIDASILKAKTITIDSLLANSTDPAPVTLTGQPEPSASAPAMSADIIRARGYNPIGDALIINGGYYRATQMIKLYAEGDASNLRFTGTVILVTPTAHLAGKSVSVDADSSVTIIGHGVIHADNHNYDILDAPDPDPDRGTISAGVEQKTYDSRPSF